MARLQQVLQELLPAVAGRVVQAAVAGAVHRVRVGPVVQQQLHHGDAVGADGVAQRRDALEVLRVEHKYIYIYIKIYINKCVYTYVYTGLSSDPPLEV